MQDSKSRAEGSLPGPSRDEIRATLRAAYKELIEFASKESIQALLTEMYSVPPKERPRFVNEVVLNEKAIQKRGIQCPAGILIQRSPFGDRRPTLFCIKKYIPEQLRTYWQNANITFDNETKDDSVPRDRLAWRPSLPFDVQQALVAGLIDEKHLPQ